MRTTVVVSAALAASWMTMGWGCNWYGNLWANASYATTSGAGDVCAGAGGAGGFGGAGGDDGAGGDGAGVGGNFGVSAGAGGSFGVSVGAGVGGGDSAWSDGDAGHVARAPRHRGHHRGIGRAQQGDCPAPPQQMTVPPPPSMMPSWQPLTTMKLRWIAAQNGIGAGQTGITQSRTIGVAFEAWVLKTMSQLPRWSMPILSPAREKANTNNGKGGLPASVIPEFVGDQSGTTVTLLPVLSTTTVYFPKSVFFEVKAVTGALTLGTSQYQILGLLDVAQIAATKAPTTPQLPPAVFFTTTGNTTVSPAVVAQGTMWKVAVWQQQVLYDANSANPNDPDLSLGDEECLDPSVYAGWVFSWIAPGPFPANPLTWATPQEQASVVVPGDPDPAEVD